MKHQQGFTLLELLLYIGLTSILITIMSQVFLATLGVRLESQNTTSVQQDGRYILARMAYDIHRAKSITIPSLGQTAMGMTLVIEENGIDETYRYTVEGRDLLLTVGTQSATLNSQGSGITSLSVTRLGNSDTISSAKDTLSISLALEDSATVSAGAQVLELQTTAGLR